MKSDLRLRKNGTDSGCCEVFSNCDQGWIEPGLDIPRWIVAWPVGPRADVWMLGGLCLATRVPPMLCQTPMDRQMLCHRGFHLCLHQMFCHRKGKLLTGKKFALQTFILAYSFFGTITNYWSFKSRTIYTYYFLPVDLKF